MIELSQLGNKTSIPSAPELASIETITARHYGTLVRFSCPEFTSLCPVTGAPDFGRIVIDYVPETKLIESKSLKLFLHSFRNYGCFHENIVQVIGTRLRAAAQPRWIRVCAFFAPRGGIPIDVFWTKGKLPDGMDLMPIDLNQYTMR